MATRLATRRTAKRGSAKAGTRRPAVKRAARSGNGNHGSTARRGIAARRKPETLRLRMLAASLTVNDLDISIAWYRDGLGFVVGERWEDKGKLMGVEVKAGAVSLYLNQDDFAKGRDRVKGVGVRIHAQTAQSVDELAERIRAYGGKIIAEPADMPWGERVFAVEDPDGFRLGFSRPR